MKKSKAKDDYYEDDMADETPCVGEELDLDLDKYGEMFEPRYNSRKQAQRRAKKRLETKRRLDDYYEKQYIKRNNWGDDDYWSDLSRSFTNEF